MYLLKNKLIVLFFLLIYFFSFSNNIKAGTYPGQCDNWPSGCGIPPCAACPTPIPTITGDPYDYTVCPSGTFLSCGGSVEAEDQNKTFCGYRATCNQYFWPSNITLPAPCNENPVSATCQSNCSCCPTGSYRTCTQGSQYDVTITIDLTNQSVEERTAAKVSCNQWHGHDDIFLSNVMTRNYYNQGGDHLQDWQLTCIQNTCGCVAPPTVTPVPPTPTPTPGAPTGLNRQCNVPGYGQATFSWNSVSGASAYILRISKDPHGDWTNSSAGDQWICVNGTSKITSITDGESYYGWSVQSSNDYPNCTARWGITSWADPFTCPLPTSTPTPTPTPTNIPPIPTPLPPSLSCSLIGSTIRWSWPGAQALLQVSGVPWLFNAWSSSPVDTSGGTPGNTYTGTATFTGGNPWSNPVSCTIPTKHKACASQSTWNCLIPNCNLTPGDPCCQAVIYDCNWSDLSCWHTEEDFRGGTRNVCDVNCSSNGGSKPCCVPANYACKSIIDAPECYQNTITYACTTQNCPNPSIPCADTCSSDLQCQPPTPTPTMTPTPTATPTPAQVPWVKLKDTSFISKNSLTSKIPLVPVAYDSDDSPENTYFIRDVAGVIAAPAINITSINVDAKTGNPEYKTTDSPSSYSLTPNSFLSYIKARKQHKVITNPDLSEIASSGIYIYQSVSPLDIGVSNSPVFNGKNVVLISSGTINIDGDFNTTGSVAIVAGQINFGNTVTQAKGIFIGNNIDSGTASFGLKIIGNLVAQTTFTKSRTQPNLNMPAIFIVFDGQKYIDLLPYLSTANYDWRQIQ